MISAFSNLFRLIRAGYVLAREGVFAIAEPMPMTPAEFGAEVARQAPIAVELARAAGLSPTK